MRAARDTDPVTSESGGADDPISALRAIAHPLRLRMLSLLTGSELSAAEVARALDITHANASYHLRHLLAAGEIVVAGEERVRGGTAKRYRYPLEPRRRASTSSDDEVLYARAVATELERRLRHRSPERGHSTSSDLEGWVDPEVWERAMSLHREASALLHEHNRAPGTAGTVHVSATTWAFRMEP